VGDPQQRSFWSADSSAGVITICQGCTQSFAGLVVCRVLLGVFEAGFVPGPYFPTFQYVILLSLGAIYLISMYYKRHELQLRVNVFFSASILAGAFSGVSSASNSACTQPN
jgi:MFS family permease